MVDASVSVEDMNSAMQAVERYYLTTPEGQAAVHQGVHEYTGQMECSAACPERFPLVFGRN